MRATCHCESSLDHGMRSHCAECGTPVCPGCRHIIATASYCRWCATASALAPGIGA